MMVLGFMRPATENEWGCGASLLLRMEAVRRGFKSAQGRLDHLKLFQLTHYLRAPLQP